MKLQWKKLILCIAVPLGVGGLSALLTRDGMEVFKTIDKPPLTPPDWVFPVVWSVLGRGVPACADGLRPAAGSELFLVAIFLQPGLVPVFLRMAYFASGPYYPHNGEIQQALRARGASAAAVSAVGGLCGLP